MQITMSREDVLDRLRNNLKRANEVDKKIILDHEKDEKDLLSKFKKKLKEAESWTYEQAKEESFRAGLSYSNYNSKCPELESPRIERILSMVEADTKEKYQISGGSLSGKENSDIYSAVFYKTPDERRKERSCD